MSKKSECLAWLIRRHGIEMTHLSGGSHIGSVLSAADIIAVLYADIMRYKSEDPKWDGRDPLYYEQRSCRGSCVCSTCGMRFF